MGAFKRQVFAKLAVAVVFSTLPLVAQQQSLIQSPLSPLPQPHTNSLLSLPGSLPVPAFQPFDPVKPLVVTRRPSDKPVWELGGLLAGSMVADIETSQTAVHSSLHVREFNPLMRTRPEAYAVSLGLGSLAMYCGRAYHRNGRKHWYLFQLPQVSIHGFGIFMNERALATARSELRSRR